jgi:hypothetical protein
MCGTVALHNSTYDLLSIQREGMHVERKRPVILKPDDPVWAELIANIEAVVSGRYAEDPDFVFGMTYAPSVEEPGFEFGVLTRKDRQNLLADMVDWRGYGNRGMSHDQQSIVIANVLDGKPHEQWLVGVFDEAVLENARITSFTMMVERMKNSATGLHFEEMNRDLRPWDDLSAAAKLQYIVRDAVISDVPFESFAEMVKNTIGDRVDAALRVVLAGQQELHAIAKLFPDDERTEPAPLVVQVKDLLEYASALEAQEKEQRLNAELKDHGKSENHPSREEHGTTDTGRKLIWMETIRRLDAAYMVGGTDALAKMNGIETYVLYAEKMTELEGVTKALAEHGDNEISQLHKQKLEWQTADMAAWMQEHFIDFREAEPGATAEKVGQVLTSLIRDDGLSPPDAADFWGCQGLAVPWEKRQHTELKEHGKSISSLAELKEMGKEKTRQPEHRESRDKEIER